MSTENPHIPEDSREKLIRVAISLFAEKGFDGTSVKDLAEAAHLNVSLVSYHFGGKENLYRVCLEQFGNERLATARRMLIPAKSMEEFKIKLGMFLSEFISCHIEQPDLARIIHRECDLGLPIAQDVFQSTFFKVFETLVEFLKQAQSQHFIRKDLDLMLMAGTLFGNVTHFGQADRINKKLFGITLKDPDFKEKIIQHVLDSFLNGCVSKEGARP